MKHQEVHEPKVVSFQELKSHVNEVRVAQKREEQNSVQEGAHHKSSIAFELVADTVKILRVRYSFWTQSLWICKPLTEFSINVAMPTTSRAYIHERS